jgi:hypothetical protein
LRRLNLSPSESIGVLVSLADFFAFLHSGALKAPTGLRGIDNKDADNEDDDAIEDIIDTRNDDNGVDCNLVSGNGDGSASQSRQAASPLPLILADFSVEQFAIAIDADENDYDDDDISGGVVVEDSVSGGGGGKINLSAVDSTDRLQTRRRCGRVRGKIKCKWAFVVNVKTSYHSAHTQQLCRVQSPSNFKFAFTCLYNSKTNRSRFADTGSPSAAAAIDQRGGGGDFIFSSSNETSIQVRFVSYIFVLCLFVSMSIRSSSFPTSEVCRRLCLFVRSHRLPNLHSLSHSATINFDSHIFTHIHHTLRFKHIFT